MVLFDFNNTSWPSEYQFAAFNNNFSRGRSKLCFLKARELKNPFPKQSDPKENSCLLLYLRTNETRLKALNYVELVERFGDGQMQDFSRMKLDYQGVSATTFLLAEICGVKWREPSQHLEWRQRIMRQVNYFIG
ncbi:MAG: hypothetical protein HS126_21550 [Anaerolineales bacterium]|nr:hypothetical protein [Anaerolineales bacterium]